MSVGLAIAAIIVLSMIAYGLSVLFWSGEVIYATTLLNDPEIEHGFEDIQVRILTIDGEQVVNQTVGALPVDETDVRVIAERDISVPEATVHVVPDDFECVATRKGRALEWARRNVECEKEFVLYLDEDTIIAEFDGLPDADVVQFREQPYYTGSWIAYSAEIYRIGYQIEQFVFGKFKYPPYAWGGGIAIRDELEQQVTWDSATITEDTEFVWRAVRERGGIDFEMVDSVFHNQAPPSIRAMVQQRRRWLSGTRQDIDLVPLRYRALIYVRTIVWSLSPLMPLTGLLTLFPSFPMMILQFVLGASLWFTSMIAVYFACGVLFYKLWSPRGLLCLILLPIATVVHSAGALHGIVSPVNDFVVTPKLEPEKVDEVNPVLDEEDFEEHRASQELR